MQLTSSRPSEPAASPGNVGGCAGRPVLWAELRPGRGPTHPLPPAGPTLAGARHAAPRLTRARVSPATPGTANGEGARPGPARPTLPGPTRDSSLSARALQPQDLGLRPLRSRRARARRRAPPTGSGTRTRSGTRRGARAVGPNQGQAAEAQARPRPLAPVAVGRARGRGLGPPT